MNTETKEREQPLLISKSETARLWGISVRMLEKMIRAGKVPSRVLGRRRLIPRSFVESFVRGVQL